MQWVSLPQDTAAKGRGFRVLPSGGIKGWWRPHVDGRLVGRCPRQVGLGLRLLGLGLGIFRPWCSFDLLRIGVSRLVVAEMANVTFDTSGTRTFLQDESGGVSTVDLGPGAEAIDRDRAIRYAPDRTSCAVREVGKLRSATTQKGQAQGVASVVTTGLQWRLSADKLLGASPVSTAQSTLAPTTLADSQIVGNRHTLCTRNTRHCQPLYDRQGRRASQLESRSKRDATRQVRPARQLTMVDLPPLLGALVVPRRLFALQVSLLQGRRLMLILGPRRGSFVLVHDGGFARIVSGGRLPLGLEGCRKQVLGWYAAAPLWISGLTACLAVLILPGFEMGSQ